MPRIILSSLAADTELLLIASAFNCKVLLIAKDAVKFVFVSFASTSALGYWWDFVRSLNLEKCHHMQNIPFCVWLH